MIVVARFDKAVFGKSVAVAIADELAVATENLRLVLQEIHNLHRRTLLVVVVNLGGVTRLQHALVNAENRILNVEEIHIDLTERCAVVSERPIADRRPGNRRKPSIENGILGGEPGEHGQLLRRKVRHDGAGSVDVCAPRSVALDEAPHGGGSARFRHGRLTGTLSCEDGRSAKLDAYARLGAERSIAVRRTSANASAGTTA